MSQTIDYWTNENGQRLRWREWPVTKPRCIVFIAHSYSFHAGIFAKCAKDLNNHQIAVYAHDHVFHGESEPATPCSNNRCQWECFSMPCRDIAERLRWLSREFPKTPLYLWGHGIGGLFALRLSMECPDLMAGIILESPFIAPSDSSIGWHKTFGAQVLSFVLPELKISICVPSELSGDELAVKTLIADPLCAVNTGMSTNLISILAREIKKLDNILPLVSKPLCVFVGEKDSFISLFSAARLEKVAASEDKKMYSYPNGHHLLHMETPEIRLQFISDLAAWLLERSPEVASEPVEKSPRKRKTRQSDKR